MKTIGLSTSEQPLAARASHADLVMHPIVEELSALIEKYGRQRDFQAALTRARSQNVHRIKGIQVLDDYLTWIDALVTWAPRERGDTRFIYDNLAEFYFFLDQEPVKSLQSPICPGEGWPVLTPRLDRQAYRAMVSRFFLSLCTSPRPNRAVTPDHVLRGTPTGETAQLGCAKENSRRRNGQRQ